MIFCVLFNDLKTHVPSYCQISPTAHYCNGSEVRYRHLLVKYVIVLLFLSFSTPERGRENHNSFDLIMTSLQFMFTVA